MKKEDRKAIASAWLDVGEDALLAAEHLYSEKRCRSCVSRSYYAAYAFLASLLVMKPEITFHEDSEGPGHASLSDLVGNHLQNEFGFTLRKQIRADIRTLYAYRLSADYHPRLSVQTDVAHKALGAARTIAKAVRARKEGYS